MSRPEDGRRLSLFTCINACLVGAVESFNTHNPEANIEAAIEITPTSQDAMGSKRPGNLAGTEDLWTYDHP